MECSVNKSQRRFDGFTGAYAKACHHTDNDIQCTKDQPSDGYVLFECPFLIDHPPYPVMSYDDVVRKQIEIIAGKEIMRGINGLGNIPG